MFFSAVVGADQPHAVCCWISHVTQPCFCECRAATTSNLDLTLTFRTHISNWFLNESDEFFLYLNCKDFWGTRSKLDKKIPTKFIARKKHMHFSTSRSKRLIFSTIDQKMWQKSFIFMKFEMKIYSNQRFIFLKTMR